MKDVDRGENRDMMKEREENEDTEMAGILRRDFLLIDERKSEHFLDAY